jgi:hypothetical protein
LVKSGSTDLNHGLIDPDPDEVPAPIFTDFEAPNPKYVFFLLLFEVTFSSFLKYKKS